MAEVTVTGDVTAIGDTVRVEQGGSVFFVYQFGDRPDYDPVIHTDQQIWLEVGSYATYDVAVAAGQALVGGVN